MSEVQYLDIPLDQLHDSPTQPRLVYNEQYLQELAADIKSHGRNLSLLLVRPRVPALFQGLDDPNAAIGYEVVYGHCRKRALELAGLVTARCEVRSMSDLEVERAQISENLQRKDVHPFEEAQSYANLMNRHGHTADQIVADTGKSRTYIYGRLKLLQAIPAVRDACLHGEFGSEVALLISRLRHPKLQERALSAIKAKNLNIKDGGKRSFRDIRRLLADMFTLDIKDAIFAPEDMDLVPSAGVCSTCVKLSGNAPEFLDLAEKSEGAWPGHFDRGNTNLCTDPTCWDSKHKAHLVREAERMRADGLVVVDGNKAKAALSADGRTVKGAYLSLAAVKTALKEAGKKSSDLPIVNIQDQRTGKTVQAVAAAELKTLGIAKPEATQQFRGSHQETPAEREAREKEQAERALRSDRLLQTCVAKMRECPRSALDLNLLTAWALERVQHWMEEGDWLANHWGVDSINDLVAKVPAMSADEQGVLLMTIVMVHGESYWLRGFERDVPELAEQIATANGIDIEVAMSTPMPAEIIGDDKPQAPAELPTVDEKCEGKEAIECPSLPAAQSPTDVDIKRLDTLAI